MGWSRALRVSRDPPGRADLTSSAEAAWRGALAEVAIDEWRWFAALSAGVPVLPGYRIRMPTSESIAESRASTSASQTLPAADAREAAERVGECAHGSTINSRDDADCHVQT